LHFWHGICCDHRVARVPHSQGGRVSLFWLAGLLLGGFAGGLAGWLLIV
jgi:hypothetical protein